MNSCVMRSARCQCGYMNGWADGWHVIFCGCPVQMKLPIDGAASHVEPDKPVDPVQPRRPDVGACFSRDRLRVTTDGVTFRVEHRWLFMWFNIRGTESKTLAEAQHWMEIYTCPPEKPEREWRPV